MVAVGPVVVPRVPEVIGSHLNQVLPVLLPERRQEASLLRHEADAVAQEEQPPEPSAVAERASEAGSPSVPSAKSSSSRMLPRLAA